MTNNLHQLAQNAWHTSPEAIALFDKAYADYLASDPAHWEFPHDIEADLEVICDKAYLDDGECPVSAWVNYCIAREYAERVAA